jgi:type I restriction enzyme S subunit
MSFNKWESISIGDICQTISETHKIKKGELIFLNTGDIERGKILHNRYSSVEKMPGQAKKSIKKGDILFSEIRPANGRWAYVDFEANDFILSTKLMVIRANEKVSSRYLYHLLTSPEIVKLLQQLAETRSGTFPQITFTQVANIEIKLPPLAIQLKIATFFDALDRKIDLNHQTNQTLETIAITIFKEICLPKSEDLPDGWRVGKLCEVVNINMGQSPSGSSFNQDGNGVVFFQGKAEFGFRFPTIDKYTTEPKKYANKFDTLLSVRAPVGTVNIATEKCCIGRGLAAVSGFNDTWSFTFHLLKSLSSKFEMYNGEGTVFGSINRTDLENIEIVIPSKEIIDCFELMGKSLDELVYKNELETQSLIMLRDSLLPKLMKGEIAI